MSQNKQAPPPPVEGSDVCCPKKCIHNGLRVFVVVGIVAITATVYFTVFGNRVGYDIDPASWLPGSPDGDPSLGTVGKHQQWLPVDGKEVGHGLSLTIVNNLISGSDWDTYFNTYVTEWDNGSPDAVTLKIRSMDYDPTCRGVLRAMKVCNGNYGPTDWNGVNQVLLKDEYIVSSIAKMNDYYLEGTNEAQRMYTMCHELGHGLGLGHSDENFRNTDLGNCLDYTNSPQNNLHPDEYNFLILEKLYGSVNCNDGNSSNKDDVKYNNDGQEVERSGRRHMTNEEYQILEQDFDLYSPCLDSIELSSNMTPDIDEGEKSHSHDSRKSDSVTCGVWNLVNKTKTSEHHELILGSGYSIRTNILLAN